jgi:hypothetical protein
MNKTIKTKHSTVTCVQASRCALTDKKIFTLELEYPRVVHSQLLTHGVFSKNSSSTRAVPLNAAIDQINANPAKYIWTKNQSGMQGTVIEDDHDLEEVFHTAKENAMFFASKLQTLGAHKQNAGRLLEPFQNIKIVLTSTEWENWDWLRNHEDAQGEIADLARAMKEARDTAEIMDLKPGEWHVPYVNRERVNTNGAGSYIRYFLGNKLVEAEEDLSVEQAKKVSMSVCAQISYRKADNSVTKAERMEGMLVDGNRVHASPFEHQAMAFDRMHPTGFDISEGPEYWPEGVTHMRRDGTFGSGNFVGWIQHRQLIKNHDGANLT